MKGLNKTFLSMVYPMLISLFMFCFVSAFVRDDLETLQIVTLIFTMFFGFLFVIGFVLNIIYNIKNNE